MGSPKELMRRALVGFWAWLLCGMATGAALPVSTQNPAIEDDFSTPDFPSTVIFDDYLWPTLPTTTEEDLDFLAETPSPSETNEETPEAVGEGETSSLGEPLDSVLVPSEDDSGSLISTSKTFKIPEDLKETPEVSSVDKNVLSQVNSSEPTPLQGEPPVESQEAPKETPSPDLEAGHEAIELITERNPSATYGAVTVFTTLEEDLLTTPSGEEAESSPEGDNLLENIPREPNLDDELKPISTSWEGTEVDPLEAEKDSPEPSMDESGTLEDPSSNPTVLPSIPEDLPDEGTGENVDAGDQPSLSSEDSPGTSQSSTPTHENFGGTSDFDVGSLQPSPTSVDSGSPEGRGDKDPTPSSSGPELNHESPIKLPGEEPEGTSLVSPLPGQASEIPDEERSGDLLSGTASSLNPGVETVNSELEDSEATTTPNSVPEGEINPIFSDLATVSENDTMVSSPPPVDHEGTDKAQEPPAETQESPAESSAPASTDGPSSQKEGSEVLPNGSPGNIGSSLETIPSASDEVDTEANGEDGSGSDLSPPDTELSPISGTSPPMGRSGTLNDQLSPSQSLVENALTSGSSEPTFPSTSPDEALSGPLISEPDTIEFPSNLLPGSQPSSQLPKEDDMETGSGDAEDSPPPPPPVDNEGAAEASAPGSINEPSSEREGGEILPSGSAGNVGPSSENSDTIPSVSSDEVDTQANSEDRSMSDLPPSEAELSTISGTPLSTSSQPPKEDDAETHSEVPEDSVSFHGEEISSAPSIINPQSDPAEAAEKPNISGDLSDGPTVSPKEERIGSTLEPRVKEEPLLDGDNTQDKINTQEQPQGSEDALDTSIPSSGDEPAAKSGTASPLVDTETSTKEASGETSSESIEPMLSDSENEDGEPSPSLSSKTLDSSPSNEVVDESRDGEGETGSASSAKTAVTVSNDGQPGSDFPEGQSVTSPVGGILALAPIEDGETSFPRDDAQWSTQPASSADGTSVATEGEDAETSEDDSTVSEKPSSLAPSSTEPQSPGTSVNNDVSGNLVNGEPSYSADGGEETVNIGTEDAQGLTSTPGTNPNQNNIAEQVGQTSETMSGQASADGAMVSKSSDETSIPSLVSSDGNLATQGTSQDFGALDSSQPSSDIQGNLANSINAGPGEDSILSVGDHISIGASEGPLLDAKTGGEVLQGVSEVAEGTKPSEVVSPLAFLLPQNGLLLAPSNLGAPKLGNVVGKGPFLSTPEERGEVVNSLLAVHKGIVTAVDGVQPSLLGVKGSLAKASNLVSGKPGPQDKADTLLLSSKPEVLANKSKLASGKPGLQTKPGAPQLSSKPEVPAKASKLVSGKPGLQGEADVPQPSSESEVPVEPSTLSSGKPGLQGEADVPQPSSESEVPVEPSTLSSGKPGLQGEADVPQPSSETEVPVEPSTLSSGKPGLQGEADVPQPSSETEVPMEPSTLSSGKPGLQGEVDAPQPSSESEVPVEPSTLSSGKPGLQGEADVPQPSSESEVPVEPSTLPSGKPGLQDEADVPQPSSESEVPVEPSKLSSGKPGLQDEADVPQPSSEAEVPVEPSTLSSGKPGLQDEADVPQPSSESEVPVEPSKLSSGKPGLQDEADVPQPSSEAEVPVEPSTLSSGKPGLQGEADVPQPSSESEVPVEPSTLSSGKPGLQGEADVPQPSSESEVPVEPSTLSSGKPRLQGEADVPQPSSESEVPVEPSKLSSGKPGLQGEADVPQPSSEAEVPVEPSTLSSGKPGLQGEADVPQPSSETEVPVEPSTLSSGKPGLQGEVNAPQPSSESEVPVEPSTLSSGKPGLQDEADVPQPSSESEVPVEPSKLSSGKPGLQGEADVPQPSSESEVPAKTSKLASGKPGLQLKADPGLLSFNSDVLANSLHTLPGKPDSASSESSSASDEKHGDSSSGPDLSEEHQTFMKATKSSELNGKAAKKRSDSKKTKDRKTKPDKKSAIINGAPSDATVSLYPYGASVNDKQYVERKVDFNSPIFKPEIGIPLGKSLRDFLYFTDNGQIVFPASDKDISHYPNPPSGGFNGREEVPMVAVFWDNADFSKGSGTIFYQEYPCGNSARHPLVQDVEAKIRRYVSSSYRARWLLKVTWDKAQHYPAQKQSSKTSTYQAILTTDGYRTYALFLYQDGGMQWDYAKLSAPNVLIGYTSGDGYFKNDPLMARTPAEKYRPDGFQGYNTDVRGLWIYKLDSWVRVNYRQRCLDWLSHERLPASWNRGLAPCPCSLKQGLADHRYAVSQKGWQNTGSTLLYSSRPNNYGAGVRCLYNEKGQLQEGRQERIWKSSRKNYPNNDEELKLHDWCCNKAGNPQMCEKYDQKRPRIGCQGYKPPIWG